MQTFTFRVSVGFGGSVVELQVSPNVTVSEIAEQVRKVVGVRPGFELALTCEGGHLANTECAAKLRVPELEAVWRRKTPCVTTIGFDLCCHSEDYKYHEAGVLVAESSIYFAPYDALQILCINTKEEAALLIGPKLPRAHKCYSGGIVAGNGKLYFAPARIEFAPCDGIDQIGPVLCIDPVEQTVHGFGIMRDGVFCTYYTRGVLANSGQIFYAPDNGDYVMRVDPQANAAFPIRLRPCVPGMCKFAAGGVLANNGKIYFAPANAPNVLVIDSDLIVRFIGPKLIGDLKYLADGLLASTGEIYFAPYDAKKVLCIDPESDAVASIGPRMPQDGKYSAKGVIASNGFLFFAPNNAGHVLCIDPFQKTVSTIGPLFTGLQNFPSEGVVAEDGQIFFAPGDAGCVLCIEAETRLVTQVALELDEAEGSQYTANGVLARSGRIYFAPDRAERVLCIDPVTQIAEFIGPSLTGRHRYRAGGVLAPNGLIYFAPCSATHVLCIDG